MYEKVDSEEKERPVCRCRDCMNKIKKAEEDLHTAIKTMDFHVVDRVLAFIKDNNIDIDVKLLNQGDVMHLKL